jgi:PAS domain S-box-containing protein
MVPSAPSPAEPRKRPPRAPRRFGLATHLLAVLLAALLPALLVGGLAVGVAVRSYRAAFEARLQDTARALSLAMDQEIAAHLQTLEALAGFTGMDPEDGLAGFDALARSAAASLGTSIFVYGPGPEWQQWVNTARPLGSPLPAGLAMGFEPRAPVPRVFATGGPALGDIATGRLLGLPRAAILVPIRQGGQVRAALGAILDPNRFSRTLASLGLANGAVATLIDGQGVVVARSERAREMTGRFVPAWYAPAITGRSNGMFTGQGLDGQPMILAFQRLATDPAWTLVVAEPASAYRNAWQTPLIALAIGGGAALAFGLLVAGLLARRLLRPLHALVGHAEAAAAGGSPIPPAGAGGGIAEFTRLRDRLAEAQAAIAERGAEAARLAAALDTTSSMVRRLDGTILHWSRGAEELYGWPAAAAIGQVSHGLLETGFQEPLAAIEARLLRDGQWEGQLRQRDRQGRALVVASRWRLHRTAPGGDLVVVEGAADITARVEAERSRDLVARELHHRVKNLLATVQALAAQTLRSGSRDPEQFAAAFTARLRAMARVQDLLTVEDWRDAELAAVLRAALSPWLGAGGRIALAGEGQARVSAKQAQALVLALHELATNAGKHGALSAPEGRVILCWRAGRQGEVALDWTERGGPPVAGTPSRRGLGSRLMQALPRELGGGATVALRYEPEGVNASMRFSARVD